MKRKIVSVFTMLFGIIMSGFGQVSGLNIGYCNGIVKTSGTTGFSSTEKDTWISGAIYIPQEQLKVYAGNRIDSINAGLASALNIDSLRVWIRTSLDGTDLAAGALSKTGDNKLVKGWNRVGLEQPYDITTDGSGLYVGYSFHQKSSSVGLSVVALPQENGLFVKLGTDAEWTDRSNEGVLAIEALVYGDHLPKYNLVLKSLSVQPVYVMDKGTLTFSATLRNIATATITGFDAKCTIDGAVYTAHIDETIAYNEEKTVSFTIRPENIVSNEPAKRTVTVEITNLAEGDDENPDDNVMSAEFEIVEHDFTRNVLIEEFTTELCPNCPRVAGQLADVLADENYNGIVNVICHHSGYYTDWLTIPAANDYLWLYNMGGSTFAPALLVDRVTRTYLSNQNEKSPIYMPSSADDIRRVVDTRMLDVAFVSLDINAEMDSANASKVTVTVTGERIKENFTTNPPRICVTLFENNITPRSQAGATTGFTHQHVERAVNSTWGDVIEWDGNSYSYTCELALRADYNRENLGILAYVWDYNSSDASLCEVANSASIHYSDFSVGESSGISTVSTTATRPVERWSASGVRMSEPQRGLNIVRMDNGEIRKVIVK